MMMPAVVVMMAVPRSAEPEANARTVIIAIVVRVVAVVVRTVAPNPPAMQIAVMSPAATDPYDILYR
jgi:hypothetical protein